MSLRKIGLLGVAFLLTCSAALAQSSRVPVKVISGFPPGGNVDILARLLSDPLSDALGRPVVVENRPGAGGQIALEYLKAAPPDGNTLVVTPDASLIVRPLTMKQPPYHPVNDFVAVAQVGGQDYAFAIGAGIPAKDLMEFAAWAKGHPDGANYGSAGQGGATHFLGLLIGDAVGASLRQIPYKGSGPAVTALVAGEVSATVQPIGTLMAQAQAGRVRIVATTGSQRAPDFPGVPTLADLGFPKLTLSNWFGVFAPAHTPADAVKRLNDIIVQALRTPAIKGKLAHLLLEVKEMTPEQFAEVVRSDYQRWAPVIKATGFSIDSR